MTKKQMSKNDLDCIKQNQTNTLCLKKLYENMEEAILEQEIWQGYSPVKTCFLASHKLIRDFLLNL